MTLRGSERLIGQISYFTGHRGDDCRSGVGLMKRIVSGVLKDKQAGAGLHKFGQHSGYNPVELSRWGAWLWGFNRTRERSSPMAKVGKRRRPSSVSGVMSQHGLAGTTMRYRQGRSRRYQRGSDIARPRLEAERFETLTVFKQSVSFKQHWESSSGARGRLPMAVTWPR